MFYPVDTTYDGLNNKATRSSETMFYPRINKQWEVIALEQLTSHMTLNAGPQQQRFESPTIAPTGMR